MNAVIMFSANRIIGGKRGKVGGFADRLKGVVTCYILSILTDRDFLIDWDHPAEISEFFAPNTVNWKFGKERVSTDANTQVFDFIDPALRPDQAEKLDLLLKTLEDKTEFSRVYGESEILKFYANFFDVDYFSPFENELKRELGIENFSNEEVFHVCFNRLFKFTCPESVENEFQRFQKFRAANKKVVGIQFRTGGSGNWEDPNLDQPQNIRQAARALRKKHSGFFKRKPAVFLTSDDPAAKEIFRDEIGKSFRVFSFNEDPIHFERSESPASREFGMVVLEFNCLTLCDDLIVGHGGFGVTAGYSQGFEPQRYWEILGTEAPENDL